MILAKSGFEAIKIHLDRVNQRLTDITPEERHALESLIDSYIDATHYRASYYSTWLKIQSRNLERK